MFQGIIMIIAGLLASPALIAGKSKNADDFLAKISPYQGWIGFVLFIWGVWGIIQSILWLSLLSTWPILWVTLLAIAILEVALGILLGFNLIDQYILSKNAQSAERGKMMHKKLLAKQSMIALIGIAVGIWCIIYDLAFYSVAA